MKRYVRYDAASAWRELPLIAALVVLVSMNLAAAEKRLISADGEIEQQLLPANPVEFTDPNLERAAGDSARQMITGNFTDLQGRTMPYRLSLPPEGGGEAPQPILIHFHGNATATQEEILDGRFGSIEHEAVQRGLIPIVVASPETRPPPQEGIRQWYEEDISLVHEFLQQELSSYFIPDFDRIYFDGASQGACFMHDFMQVVGDRYGGGFYGGCGCYNSPDPSWVPEADFVSNFKVFINSSVDDFLYETANRGYAYYRYTIGVETYNDLNNEGPHCSTYWSSKPTALDWFIGALDLQEQADELHWIRTSPIIGLNAITLLNTGNTIVVQDQAQESIFWHIDDATMRRERLGSSSGTVRDVEFVDDRLFFVENGSLLSTSLDDFSPFNEEHPSAWLLSDGDGRLFSWSWGLDVSWSADAGGTWQSFADTPVERIYNEDSSGRISSQRIVASTTEGAVLGDSEAGIFEPMEPVPEGQLFSAGWDGERILVLTAVAGEFYSVYKAFASEDGGGSWLAVTLPSEMVGYPANGTAVSASDRGVFLIHGGFRSSWITTDGGATWQRVFGLGTAWNGDSVISAGRAVYTDGEAVFSLNAPHLLDHLFGDGFE